ncbi:aminotransferase class III-fold pyridoxal phosphate-dependent enzyme [Microtetraspora sp. NBRC 13810]|uniref:aminotransferase class III-fold pyridoxal phosphate-dependent enzyme n=1 Tax=Microtetraspora sp. NBRC 13810 TaxID=3030990 RepID=UPI002553E351|nr:aminotransferase class III-fold pyridoxal phosphate-dependent enzyme [Microtetraspora sp. NBRC 13810]
MFERARRVTAAEDYDIQSRYPSIIERGDGPWLYDVEGTRLLDLTAGDGSLLLGHRPQKVIEAVTKQMRDYGANFSSTLSIPRIELAERLVERYPVAEKVVFSKTGSEATTLSVRLARAATGRDLILSSGFHGWHEWHLPYGQMGFDPATGVANFGYNEKALARMLTEFSSDVAGVIMSTELYYFDPEYYQRLSAMCRKHDVPFIMDEVFSGFRCGSHGLHGSGKVPADMVVISKGLTNGHPLSVVMGRRDLIDAYDTARAEGTYLREVPAMAAGLAVLDIIEDGSQHANGERMGQLLMDGMRDILNAHEIPNMVGGPPMFFDVITTAKPLMTKIYRTAYDYGVHFDDCGTQLVLTSFDESNVDFALSAFERATKKVIAESDIVPGELNEEFRLNTAEEEFGGYLRDDDRTRGLIEQTVQAIANRDRSLGPWRHAMGERSGH